MPLVLLPFLPPKNIPLVLLPAAVPLITPAKTFKLPKLLELPVGSSYFPEWKPTEVLKIDEEEIKASNGSRYWNALYMQNPTPEEGGLIKKKAKK